MIRTLTSLVVLFTLPALANPGKAVRVHIDSDSRDVRLYRFVGTSYGTGWTSRGATTVAINTFADECRAPCDETIQRPDDQFFIAGSGVTGTQAIVLSDFAKKGVVNMEVKAGSSSGHFLGMFSMITGITGVVLGLTFALLGAAMTDPLAKYTGYSRSNSGFVIGGLVTGLIGGGLMAIGIPVMLGNRTEVTFDDGTVVR